MKLRKNLTVDGRSVKLVSEDIRLDLFCPGRAMFQVQAAGALSGPVAFSLGYSIEDRDQVFFSGYVEKSHTVDNTQQRLFCRELAAVLHADLPVSLRHPTLRNVLKTYAGLTGLAFALPDRPYANRPVPCFQTLGNGFHGLDAVGGVFAVADYVWTQQGNGTVFVGSWQDSRWAKRPVEIPDKWSRNVTSDGRAVLPALPALRPGVRLNGLYLARLQLAGHEMVVQCSNRLRKPS